MTTRQRKWLFAISGLLLLFALFIWLFDWNWLKKPIAERITAESGRAFSIQGNLDVDLSLTPRIRAERVKFANADWGTEPQMLDIEVLEFTISLVDLIRGKVVAPEVVLTRPQIVLEKNRDGKRNWILDKQQQEEPPQILRLTVDQGQLIYRDPAIKTDIALAISSETLVNQPGIRFKAQGRFKGMDASAAGKGGAILSIRDTTYAYPLDAQVKIGATRAWLKGTITGLVDFAVLDLDFNLSGRTLSELFPILEITLPTSPPYRLKGHLAHQGKMWQVNRFSGVVGDSDLAGEVNFDTSKKPKLMQGNLVSRILDFDDLAGFIGAPPATDPGETASPQQKKTAAVAANRQRVLPDTEFRVERLQAMDADVHFKGESIRRRASLPLDDLVTHLKLQSGILTLDPLNFGVADGNIIAKVVLNSRTQPVTTQVDIQFRKLKLNKLFPTVKLTKTSVGQLGGKAKLIGYGNSFANMLGSANGQLGLAMAGGEISNLILEFAGIDGAEIMKFLVGGDKNVPIRCAVADFEIKQGLMQTKVFVIDTTDTNIYGEGSINLANESLNLTLRPKPKDMSIFSARAPLYVRGTFKQPKFKPDTAVIAARGGTAILLGTLAGPLAALIPLIETGPGKDNDCNALFAQLKQSTGAIPPKTAQTSARLK